MGKTGRKAAVALAYIAGVLAFFEGASRLALSSDAFFKRVAGDDQSSWRLGWAARHLKQGRIYYEFDVHHPTRGWALKPNVRDLDVYGGKVLNSNAHGLRGRQEFSYDKPPGTRRILVLGDSFTFGEGVSDDETYSHYLSQRLPGVEVLNMGVHGYGQDQMLLYLREEGVKYHPDAVVLGFVYADIERNLLAFRDYAKPRFVLRDGRLVLTNTPIPPPEEMIEGEIWRSKFLDLLAMLRGKLRGRSGAKDLEARRLAVAILDAIRETIVGIGARPAFAYLPVWGEISKPDMAMTDHERFFFSYCRERGIQSMYLRPFFLKQIKQGVSFKTSGHWDAAEHRVVAEGIEAYLREKGVIEGP